jgi:excisionase family DNA binding protein
LTCVLIYVVINIWTKLDKSRFDQVQNSCPMNKKLFTIQQVANQVGVSTKTLRRWEAKGAITAQRTIGNQRRYTQEDIDALSERIKKSYSPVKPVSSEPQIPSYYAVSAIKEQDLKPEFKSSYESALSMAEEKAAESETAQSLSNIASLNMGFQPIFSNFGSKLHLTPKLKTGLMLSGFVVIGLVSVAGTAFGLFPELFGMLIKSKSENLKPLSISPAVLAESIKFKSLDGEISFNIPAIFNSKVTINDDALISGNATVSGTLTAPNIVYAVIGGQNVSITGDPQNPVISTGPLVSSFGGQTGDLVLTAGTGISVDGLTLNNTGVINLSAGSGIALSGSTGSVTISSDFTGVTSLSGTANQVNVSAATGAVTLSLPQDIHAGAAPSFSGLIIDGDSITDFSGNGLEVSSNALVISILSAADSAGGTSSRSGLEFGGPGGNQLSLLQGCSNGELLKWNETTGNWECGIDTAGIGSAVVDVREGGTPVGANITVMNFSASDFALNESPMGQANIAIDYTNSFITRSNQNQTITGNWSFPSLNLTSNSNQIILGTTNTTTITSPEPAAPRTATIPVLSANDSFCFVLLGNCAGSGTGVTAPVAGTTNRIAKFTSGQQVGNSSINDLSSALAMTIDASGQVGIGTTGPTALLDLLDTVDDDNTLTIRTTSDTVQPMLRIANDAASPIADNDPAINFMRSGSSLFSLGIDLDDANKFKIARSGSIHSSTALTIDRTSGNIGLGTAAGAISPATRLVVAGSTADSSASALDVQSSTGTSLFYVRNDGRLGVGTTSPSYQFDVVGGTGIVGQFSGRVIGGDAVNANEFATKAQVDAATGGGTKVSSLNTLTGALTLAGTTGEVAVNSNGTDTLTIDLDPAVSLLGQTISNAELVNSGVTINTGTGLSGGGAVALGGTLNLANTGVTSNIAGTGISVSGATGDVTITNTGVTSLSGTANQVNVSAATGAVTLSLPQDIHAGASPTFASLNLTTTTNQIILGTTNTTTISSVAPAASRVATIPSLAASDTFVFENQTQTLTNKTIAAGNNTISGLTNSNLSGTAGITNANLADMATSTIKGRVSAGSGAPEDLTVAQVKTLLNLAGTNSGDVTLAGENYLSIVGQVITANAVNLGTSNVTGVLPLANGGTNANLTAIQGGIVYSGASALAISSAGTTGECLKSGGTGAPTWGNCTAGAGGDITAVGDVGTGAAFDGTQGNILQFEGTTVDGFEVILTGADAVGADFNLTLPAVNGELSALGQVINNGELEFSTVSFGGVSLSLGGSDATPAFNLADATNLPIDAGTTGTLPILRGGTNSTSIGSAGSLAYSTGTAYGFSGVGTAGQVILSGGTGAPTFTTGTLALAGNFSTTGANTLTLATTGATSLTLPTTGTLATLAGTEVFTNKTLTDSSTLFQDETDNTKKFDFQLSGITTGTTRTLTIPDATGTICISTNNCNYQAAGSYESPLTFSNGLTRTVNAVALGGALTANTDIPLSGFNLTLSGSGNVGIGTTAPLLKLEVVDNSNVPARFSRTSGDILQLYASGGTTGNHPQLGFTVLDSGGSNAFTVARLAGVPTNLTSGSVTGGLRIYTRDAGTQTTAVDILGNGNVGIGTTAPLGKLHLANAAATQFFIEQTDAAADNKLWDIQATGAQLQYRVVNDANSTASQYMLVNRSGIAVTNVNFPNGNVGIGDVTPASLLTVGNGDLFQVDSTGAILATKGFTQQSGVFSSTLTTTNAATFGSTTSGSDILALLPQSTTTTNAFTGTITSVDLTAARQWAFPNTGGAICIVEAGNCAGSGTGVTTPGGTTDRLAKFTGAQSIGDSGIADTSDAVAITIDSLENVGIGDTSPLYLLTVGNGDLFGVNSSGNIVWEGSTADAFELTLAPGNVGQDSTVTIPDPLAATDTVCLLTLANCVGTGGGVDGTGVTNRVAYWTDANTISQDDDFFFDGSAVGIGTTTPNAAARLHISGGNLFLDQDSGAVLRFYGDSVERATIRTPDTASDLLFETNGSEKLRILANGNVGIGTTAPASILHLHSTSVTTDRRIILSDGTSGATTTDGFQLIKDTGQIGYLWNYETAGITFGTSNTARMHMSSTGGLSFGSAYYSTNPGANNAIFEGNVGIGTTNPGAKLDVVGSGIFGNSGSGSYGVLISNNDQTNVRLRLTNTGSGGQSFSLVGGNPGLSNAGLAVYDETNTATRLYIDSTGNVGIGTTAPGAKLDVNGSARIMGGNAIYFQNAAGDNNGTISATGGAGSANLSLNATGGNVGIGTTAPQTLFHLDSTGNTFSRIEAPTGGYAGLQFNTDSTTNWSISRPPSRTDLAFFNGSDQEKLTIQQDGDLGIGTTNPGAKLDVSGTINVSSGAFGDAISFFNGYKIKTTAGGGLRLEGGPYTVIGNVDGTTTAGTFSAGYTDAPALNLTPLAAQVGFGIQGATSQTADLLQLKDINGLVNASFNAAGNQLTLGRIASSGTVTQGKLVLSDGTTDNFGTTIQSATMTVGSRTLTLPNTSGVADTFCLLTLANCVGAGGAVDGTGVANRVAFWTDANTISQDDDFFFDGTNVGIGTTSTASKLDVGGTLTISDITNGKVASIIPNISVNGSARTLRFNNATSAGTEGFQFYNSDSSTSLMMIQQNGNVGIGTTNPSYPLHVSTATDQLIGWTRQGVSKTWTLGADASGSFINNATDSVLPLYITNAGNVGIGVTNPSYKLQVEGSANDTTSGSVFVRNTADGTGSGAIVNVQAGTSNTASGYLGAFPSTYNSIPAYADRLVLNTNSDASGITINATGASQDFQILTGGTGSGNERFRIDSSGNVGIGVTNPGALLQVGGNVATSGNLFFTTSNAGVFFDAIGTFNNGVFKDGSGNMDFRVNSTTERMTIDTLGNVGIGTTTPSESLELNGNIELTGQLQQDGNNFMHPQASGYQRFVSGGSTIFWLDSDNNAADTDAFIIAKNSNFFGGGHTEIFRVNENGNAIVSGNIQAATGSFTSLSSGTGNALCLDGSNNIVTCTVGSGGVSKTGSGLANRVAYFTTDSNITGSNNFFFDGTNVGIGNTVPGNYRLNVTGALRANSTYTSYTGDGLFGATALPSIIATPGGQELRFGYLDDGAGSYVPRIGFYQATGGNVTGANNSLGNQLNGDFSINVGTANQERIRIQAGGNVGIGVTNPGYKLEVAGSTTTAKLGKLIIADDSPFITGANLSSGSNALALGSTGAAGVYIFTNNTEKMRLSAAGGLSLGNSYVGTDPGAGSMIISGSVGIGTTGPSQKLHVYGDTTPAIRVQDSTNNVMADLFADNTNAYVGSGSNHPLALITNSVTRMYFDTSGNVGIGTTAPNAKLEVATTYSSATAGEQYGQLINTTYGIADSGLKQGLRLNTTSSTTGTLDNLVGVLSLLTGSGSGGTTTSASSLWSRVDVGAGHTVSSAYGLNIQDGAGSGTIGNQYGVFINSLVKGSTNYALYTAGTTQSYFGGNVGIGDLTPASALTVGNGDLFQVNSSGDIVKLKNLTYSWPSAHTTNGFLKNDGSGTLTWTTIAGAGGVTGTGVANRVAYWDTTSNITADDDLFFDGASVGIGTTNPSSFKLQVAGHVGPNANDTYDLGSDSLRWRDLYLGGETLHLGTSTTDEATFGYNTATNILNFGTDATTNGDIAFFTDDLYLDKSTGNVGIGTTGPTSLLTVNQSSNTTDGTPNSYGITLSNQGTVNMSLGSDASYAYLQSWASKPLKINSQGNNTLLNPTSGNVGIGTTAPSAKLQVAGDLDIGSTAASGNIYGTFSLKSNAVSNGGVWIEATGNTNALNINHNGSVGIITTDYTGTGSFLPLALQTNGGTVGIGTTGPGAQLDVRGSTGSGVTALRVVSDVNADDFVFKFEGAIDSTTNVMAMTQPGNVGIGTTDPGAALDVRGTNSFFGATRGSTYITNDQLNFQYDVNANSQGYINYRGYAGGTTQFRDLGIYDGKQNNIAFFQGSTGNVGIGVTNPSAKLAVAPATSGGIYVGTGTFENSAGWDKVIDLQGSAHARITARTANVSMGMYAHDSWSVASPQGYLGTYTNHPLAFMINASQRMVLDTSGNVGIGLTNPSEQLELTGNLELPVTTASAGIIKLAGGTRYIHNYGTNNFFAGTNAGNLTQTGSQNTAVGVISGGALTTGTYNTFLGYNSGSSVADGYYNTLLGGQAGQGVTSGVENVMVGLNAGVTGNKSYSTILGSQAGGGGTNTGDWNVMVGRTSGFTNTSGTQNVFLGGNAAYSNLSGSYNAAIGQSALQSNSTGNFNVALGISAGYTLTAGNANTTGSSNSFIGAYSGPASATQLSNASAIGAYAVVGANNSLVLGCISGVNSCPATPNVGIGTTAPSQLLHVLGSSGSDVQTYIQAGSANDNAVLSLQGGRRWNLEARDSDTWSSAFAIRDTNAGADRLLIDFNGNVGIGTTTPGSKLTVAGGDLTVDRNSVANTGNIYLKNSTTYSSDSRTASISVPAGLSGRIINRNADMLDGTTGYAVYDNSAGGKTTISSVASSAAPNSSGSVLRVSYDGTGTPNSNPTPGYGGFYVALNRCSGTNNAVNGYCYREGNRYIHRIWAKIPSGRTLTFASNSYGTGASHLATNSWAGTGNWESYEAVQTIGTGGTFSSTGFWYVDGGTNAAFTWDVAYVAMTGVDEGPSVLATSNLNVGYYQGANLGFGEFLTTQNTYLAASGGNVGIGTTAPLAQLNINQATDVQATLRLSNNGTSGRQINIKSPAAGFNGSIEQSATSADFIIGNVGDGALGALKFQTFNADRLTILNTGNVGIGTTSPGAPLEVSHSSTGDIAIFSTAGGTDRFKISADTNDSNLLGQGGNNLKLGTSASGTSITILNSTGNVGIGATNPGVKLDIAGSAQISQGNFLRFPHTSESDGNDGKIGAGLFATGLNIVGSKTDATYRKLSIWGEITQQQNDGTNSWMGNSTFSGSIGIGSTGAPSTQLHVTGGARITGLASCNTIDTDANGVLACGADDGGSASGWTDDGTVVRLITSTDNVGIGTSTPGSDKLYVYNGSSNAYLRIGSPLAQQAALAFSDDTNGQDAVIYRPASSRDLSFFTATNGDSMRLLQNGNFGIGVTNPSAKLAVAPPSSGGIYIGNGTFENSAGWDQVIDLQGSAHARITARTANVSMGMYAHDSWSVASPQGYLGTYTNHPLAFMINASQRMVLDTSGNLGIGTTGPETKLHIASGNLLLSNNQQILFENSGGTNVRTFDLDSGNNLNIGRDDNVGNIQVFGIVDLYDDAATPAKNISFDPATNGNSYFNTGGNVGIGTTAPGATLDVVAATDPTLRLQGTGTNSGSYLNFVSRLGGADRTAQIYSDWNGNFVMLPTGGALSVNTATNTAGNNLTVNGRATIGSGAYLTTAAPTNGLLVEGNVGIGTSAPTQKLNVYDGNVQIDFGNLRFSTVVPPGAPTVALGGAGGPTGTYTYRITFVTAQGETELGTASSSISPSNQAVNLTAIPTGTSGVVTQRKIYRNKTADPNVWYFVATLANNTTTTYTDTATDAAITVVANANNTTGGRTLINGTQTAYANFAGQNTAFGWATLAGNTSGTYNTASGYAALLANTTGFYNTAYGGLSLSNNTSGSFNTAVGMQSLTANTTGTGNVAQGYVSLASNTTGNYNVGTGYQTVYANTTGAGNIGMGLQALLYNRTGSYNIAIGYTAGYGQSTLSDITGNTLVGYQTGYNLLTGGNYNTILGYGAGTAVTTGTNNSFLGVNAGNNVTTGSNNIIIGQNVTAVSATGSNQLNIGNTIYGDLSTDFVGIGATTPLSLLHTAGVNHDVMMSYSANGDYRNTLDNSWSAGSPTSNYLRLNISDGSTTGQVTVATFRGDGNVGIGTTAPTSGYKLDVSGDAILSGGTKTFQIGTSGCSQLNFQNTSNYISYCSNQFNFTTTQSQGFNFMGGNVGISTTAPSTKLHINAEIIDDAGRAYDTNALMVIHQTPTSTTALNDPEEVLYLGRQGTTAQAYGALATFKLSRYENSSTNSRTRLDLDLTHGAFTDANVMTWLSSGNVGIGSTNPGAKLTVGTTMAGTAQSSTFATNAGSLGAVAGNELALGSFGFSSVNTTTLGIRAIRTGAGSDWTTTAVGIGMDVDNTVRAGGAALWLNANGNVGIGITNPANKFDVAGSVGIGSYAGTAAPSNGLLVSGAVGIGTTNPLAKLAVNALGTIGSANQNAYDIGAGRMAVGEAFYSYDYICAGNASGACSSTGGVVIRGGGTPNTSATVGLSTGVSFFNGGNVGIGNTAPSTMLHVGNASLSGSNGQITLGKNDGSGNRGMVLGYDAAFDFGFYDSGTTKQFAVNYAAPANSLYINSAGSVGIGTSAPSQKLNVYDGNVQIDFGNLRFSTVVPPGAPTVALGGAGGPTGTYTYRITFVTAQGETELGTASSSISPSNQAVNLTAIPTGTSGVVTQRKIYRNKTADPNVWYFVATLANNTTTTYTDTATDAAITVVANANNTTGGRTLINGTQTAYANFAGQNTAFGWATLAGNTSGTYNTASGYAALLANTTGFYNTAYGGLSLYNNTTGYYNTAIGMQALQNNTTGYMNVATGTQTLYNNTTGAANIASGMASLFYNETGSHNVAIGYYAGNGVAQVGGVGQSNVTGNVLLGTQTGFTLRNGGNFNVMLGYGAGIATTTGAENVLIGYNAGNNLTTGSNNIIIGQDVAAVSATGNDQLNIGNTIYGNLATGNVGIGVTNPATRLHVKGLDVGENDAVAILENSNCGTACAQEDFSENLRLLNINTSGRVGMGFYVGTGGIDAVENIWMGTDNGGSNFSIATNESGTLTERFRVNSSTGNVGIGTTAPAGLLDISKALSAAPSAIGKYLSLSASTLTDNTTAASGTTTANYFNTIAAPTLGATNTSVTTTIAANLAILGAPIKGTNNTATNSVALYIATANVGAQTASTALRVEAMSGATNNFAATFTGGNVGIGTNSPTAAALVVNGAIDATFATANTERLCWDAIGSSNITDCTGTPGDYAEYYGTSDSSIGAGDVVIVDPSRSSEEIVDEQGRKGSKSWVVKSNTSYQTSLIGIVSTDPNEIIGDNFDASENPRPVALNGRVPVKVASSSAEIKAGDYITSSNEPGKAMKATRAGQIIGKALEDWTPGSGKQTVMVFVTTSYADPNNALATLAFDENGNLILPFDEEAEVTALGGTPEAKAEPKKDLAWTLGNVVSRLNKLEEKVASGSATIDGAKLDVLTDKVELIDSELSGLKTRTTILEDTVNLLATGSATMNTASGSAELSLETIDTTDVTISNTLSVGGRTTLSDVGITGKMNIGLLSVEGLSENGYATINTTSGKLHLQSDGVNGIDILDGKIVIEPNGNMKVSGTVTVKKLNVDIADTAGASLGEAILEAGVTKVTIDSTSVTSKSKIFITPRTKTTQPMAVTGQINGESFDVEISLPTNKDIKFNWWIVN